MVDRDNTPFTDLILNRNKTEMQVLTHEFAECFFHPGMKDVLVCLEKDVYPKNMVSYKLKSLKKVFAEKTEKANGDDTDALITAELKANQSVPKGGKKDAGKEDPEPVLDEEAVYKNSAGVIEFGFDEHLVKQETKEGYDKLNIAVSLWDMSTKYPCQIKEQRFEGKRSFYNRIPPGKSQVFNLWKKTLDGLREVEDGEARSCRGRGRA